MSKKKTYDREFDLRREHTFASINEAEVFFRNEEYQKAHDKLMEAALLVEHALPPLVMPKIEDHSSAIRSTVGDLIPMGGPSAEEDLSKASSIVLFSRALVSLKEEMETETQPTASSDHWKIVFFIQESIAKHVNRLLEREKNQPPEALPIDVVRGMGETTRSLSAELLGLTVSRKYLFSGLRHKTDHTDVPAYPSATQSLNGLESNEDDTRL